MAYVVDEKGNAKTTLNVVVPTLHDKVVAGKDVIPLTVGGVALCMCHCCLLRSCHTCP